MVSMTPWHVLLDGSQISYFCTNSGLQWNVPICIMYVVLMYVHSISLAWLQIFVHILTAENKSNKYNAILFIDIEL